MSISYYQLRLLPSDCVASFDIVIPPFPQDLHQPLTLAKSAGMTGWLKCRGEVTNTRKEICVFEGLPAAGYFSVLERLIFSSSSSALVQLLQITSLTATNYSFISKRIIGNDNEALGVRGCLSGYWRVRSQLGRARPNSCCRTAQGSLV